MEDHVQEAESKVRVLCVWGGGSGGKELLKRSLEGGGVDCGGVGGGRGCVGQRRGEEPRAKGACVRTYVPQLLVGPSGM